MSSPSSGSNPSDEIDVAIVEWIQAMERGERPDRESFLRRYAHISDELRQFLNDYRAVFPHPARIRLAEKMNAATNPIPLSSDGIVNTELPRKTGPS